MHMVVNGNLYGIEVSISVEKKVRMQNLNCGAGLKRGGGYFRICVIWEPAAQIGRYFAANP